MSDAVYYRDRQGKPLPDVEAWAKLWEDPAYRFLARNVLPSRVVVITIWNGIVSPVLDGLFYTGVFESVPGDPDGIGKKLDETPAADEANALVNHLQAIARWGNET